MKLSLKKKNKVLWIAVIALGVIGVGVKVDAELSLRQEVAKELAKEIAPALQEQLLNEEEFLGLSNIDVSATGLTNLRVGGKRCYGSSSSTSIYRCGQMDIEEWPTSSSSLAFRNTRSTTSTLKRLIFDMTTASGGVPSSTFTLSCGTSTQSAAPYDAVSPPDSIFRDVMFVTGTPQVVLDSNIIASSTVGPSSQYGSILVKPNDYVVCVAQANPATPANRNCGDSGATCEPVTSTNRGWKAMLIAEWEWTEGHSF